MLEVPESILVERRMTGADRRDEMWDGELHMVPPASDRHQDVSGQLFLTLAPLAKDRGLLARIELGLFRPGVDNDYRVPDQMYARPEVRSERGIEGPASLVVEILSPHDETYAKLGFFGSIGVAEVLVIDPKSMTVELFTNRDGAVVPVAPAADGVHTISSLGVTVHTVDGRLRIAWDGGSADI